MDDGPVPATAGATPPGSRPETPPDEAWVRRQRLLALIGTLLALLGLALAFVALLRLRPTAGADGYAVTAVIAGAVLVLSCGFLGWCWTAQLRDWRTGTESRFPARVRSALVAHLLSYAAVLVAMYATLAASALAGWSSTAATLFGISFLLVIFGQIIGGTQLLRRTGPPGTVPNYLRRLNAKIQSLR